MKTLIRIVTFLAICAAASTEAEPVRISVQLGDYRFRPDRIQVHAGQEIELKLTNTDTFTPHNLILKAPEAGLDIAVNVAPGSTETVRFTPTHPGAFPFHCDKRLLFFKSHRERGMTGWLMVYPAEK